MDCPECGDTFSTKRGMKIHHKSIHGESIAGFDVDCENCSTTVTKDTLEHGEHHFCSRDCQKEWQSDYQSGEDNPSFKGNTLRVTCYECGEEIERFLRSFKRRERFFCSQECNHSWQSTEFSGDGNPNWKGGDSQIEYGKGWRTARRLAQDYYDNTCQECGSSESELERKPDIHHIEPVESFDDKSEAHKKSNLIQLCRSCHLEEIERMDPDRQRERFKSVLRE